MRIALFCSLLAALPSRAQIPAPPAWVQDAVFYQVFPERFRNGDPTNDPTHASLDFPENVPADAWRVSPWTGDWYARADWERALGPDFYDHGVFLRRYGGDLQGVLDQLGYLDSLGVTALYFNPVFYAPSLHKYDAASYHHIDPYFGPDPEGDLAQMARETSDPATWRWTSADSLFLRLLREAHARGMRVVLDGVFNHSGMRFFAFEDLRRNQQRSPYRDWYVVTRWDDPATTESEFDWQGWWGYKPLPVFADNADTTDLAAGPKDYVFAITRRWMDPDGNGDPADGIDGWRLDVANEVPPGFWADWNALVRRLNPEAYTVAEVWDDAAAFLAAGGFHATKNYHGFAIPTYEFAVKGRLPASGFAQQLAERFGTYAPETARALLNLTDSHDTDRLASMLVNRGRPANYDRENGPRGAADYDVGAPGPRERDLQRLIVTLQMAMPGAPMLYYGDEAGMWGADDPDDRKPMVWPDLVYEPERGHPRGQARRADPVAFDHDLFAFHQAAIRLRGQLPSLRRGTFEVLAADAAAQTLAFARRVSGEEVVVMLNRSDEEQRIALPRRRGSPLVPIFASRGDLSQIPSIVITFHESGEVTYTHPIPPRTAVVFRQMTDRDVRPNGLNE
ncbi:MAG TPA: glycoside hydrolase family 13 protein [Rubricoccaceae bacterium]|nr:glycoside hydrolase family 13 protein [Rubricoccaceae bacterium]